MHSFGRRKSRAGKRASRRSRSRRMHRSRRSSRKVGRSGRRSLRKVMRRRLSKRYRSTKRWVKKHPGRAAIGALGTAAALGGAVYAARNKDAVGKKMSKFLADVKSKLGMK
jgi:hypothetical protein